MKKWNKVLVAMFFPITLPILVYKVIQDRAQKNHNNEAAASQN